MASTQLDASSRAPTLIPKLSTLGDSPLKRPSALKELKQPKLLGILFDGRTFYGGEGEILSLVLVLLMGVKVA